MRNVKYFSDFLYESEDGKKDELMQLFSEEDIVKAGKKVNLSKEEEEDFKEIISDMENQNESLGLFGLVALILSTGKVFSLIGSFLKYLSNSKLANKLGLTTNPYAILLKDRGILGKLADFMKSGGDKYTHFIEDKIGLAIRAIPESHFQDWFTALTPTQQQRVEKLITMTILITLAAHGSSSILAALKHGDLVHAAAEGGLTSAKTVEIGEIAHEVIHAFTSFFSAAADVATDAPDMLDAMAHNTTD